MNLAVASPKPVVIYARLSQDVLGDHLGIDRQVAECREWAERNGREVIAVVEDNDISATKGLRREGFERIVDGEFGDADVLAWHTDRFIRVMPDLERTISKGLAVHAVHAGFLDLSTPAGRAVARTVTAWATYEGEQKALRQRASHQQRAGAGKPFLGGARPFGFDKDMEGHTLVIRIEEATVLREAYTRLLSGQPLTHIARWMNDVGLLGTAAQARWTGHAVRQILIQPRNAGILTYNKKEVGPGNWTPIVAEETYRAAMAILTDPRRRTPGPRKGPGAVAHLLTGLVVCGQCDGAVAVTHKKTSPSGPYRLYMCRSGHSSARADWLEGRMSALIVERFTTPYNAENGGPVDDNSEALREELARLQLKGEHYVHMLDADEMSFDQFSQLNSKNLARIQEIERSINAAGLNRQLAALLDVDDFQHHWVNVLVVQERNAIARSYLEKIVIHPRGKGVGKHRPGVAFVWVRGEAEPRALV